MEPWVLATPGWSHDYAMGVTPYPGSDDSFENPTLLVSDDGTTWVAGAGGLDPLWLPTPEVDPTHTFWPDPSLVFDEATGRLHYFWQGHWYAYTDDEGATVSEPVQIVNLPGDLSPSLMFEDGLWHMWSVWKGNPTTDPNVVLHRTAPSPTGPWSDPVACTVAPAVSGKEPWHISVHRVNGYLYALLVVCSTGTSGAGSLLYLAISSDGVTWTNSRNPILSPVSGAWDGAQIYRASLVEIAGVLHVWYSARSTPGVWHTGRTVLRHR